MTNQLSLFTPISTTKVIKLLVSHTHQESTSIDKDNTDTDHVSDFLLELIGDLKQMKRYTSDMIHHDQTIIKVGKDGSIFIIPRPRYLPNEILLLILNQLCHEQQRSALFECTLVSKQFNMLTSPLLWQLPIQCTDNEFFEQFLTDISYPPHQLPITYPHQTIGHFIRHLIFTHDSHINNDQLSRLLPHVPLLHHLTLDHTSFITDKSFQHLPFQCQQLQSLSTNFIDLTVLSFSSLACYCHQLTTLEWTLMNQYHHQQSIEWLGLFTSSLHLKHLTLQALDITEKAMSIIQTWHHLTRLTIKVEQPNRMNYLLSNTPHTPWWPRLTHLLLEPCCDVNDTTMIQFIQLHPQLSDMELTLTDLLTDHSLAAMATSLDHLSHLCILGNNHPNMTTKGVYALVQQNTSPSLARVRFYSRHVLVHTTVPRSTFSGGTVVDLDQQDIQQIKVRYQQQQKQILAMD